MRAVVGVLVLAFAATAAAHPLMTKSQAQALIRDVNLKASDMPGYDSMPNAKPTARDRRRDSDLARCGGSVPLSKSLAWGQSRAFTRGTLDDYVVFASSVIVYRAPKDLSKDLRALRTKRWRDCFRTSVIESAGSAGYAANVTLTTLQTNVSGVFGYRLKIEPISTSSSQPTSYADIFLAGTRSTEARVFVDSSPSPPTQNQDDKVVRIVKTRLQARANPNTVL